MSIKWYLFWDQWSLNRFEFCSNGITSVSNGIKSESIGIKSCCRPSYPGSLPLFPAPSTQLFSFQLTFIANRLHGPKQCRTFEAARCRPIHVPQLSGGGVIYFDTI